MADLYDEILAKRDTSVPGMLGGPRDITDSQLRKSDRVVGEATSPSVWQGLEAASRLESTGIAVHGIIQESNFEPDPSFVFPAQGSDRFKQVTQGLPPELWPNLGRARSDAHLDFIHERAIQELQASRDLAEMGGVGTAIHIGRAILDEGALAMTAATGGLAAPFVYGAKVGRLARFARLGALTAAENTALDGVLLKSQETKDSSDLLYSALGGFALGGTVGALTRGEQRQLGKAIKGAADAHDLQMLNEAGIASVGRPVKSKLVTAVQSAIGAREEQAAALEQASELRSVGAAQAAPESMIRPLLDEQTPTEVLNTPKLSGLKSATRFDLAASLASSENPWVRFLGSKAVADPVGYRGIVNEISAEEVATFLRQKAGTQFAKEANPALGDWLAANKVPLGERTGMTARFFENVTEAVRGQDFSDPHIGRAAKGWINAVHDVASEAKKYGVKGFEDLELRADYVPRVFSHEKIAMLNDMYGTGQIERLISRAIAKGTNIADERAAAIAKGYLHRVRRVQAGLDAAPQFALKDKDLLATSMKDAGIPDKQIEEALGSVDFGVDESKAGKVARAKRRLTMDEDHVAQLKDRSGMVRPVALTDLFENDARLLLHNYTRMVAGHTALAKTMGVTSRADWEALLRKAIAYGEDNLNMSKEDVKADLGRLDFVHKAITGQPVEDFTSLHKALHVIRDVNFIRMLNQAGFAQAADIGNVIGFGGWRTTISHLPAVSGMIKRIRETGELSDELASELEAIIPLGTDGLRHATPSRFDTGFTDALEPALTSSLGKKADVALAASKKLTGEISGLTPLTIIQQRMASRAIAQNFINTAFQSGGKKIGLDRLMAMGLDESMAERIFGQMREHAMTEPGVLTGRVLKKLYTDNWTDLDARDAFAMAVYRQGRRLVQENDLGSSSMFMHKEVGKVLFQFRSFMLNAYSKQLLHNFTVDGWKAFEPWAYSAVFGGLAYTLRQLAATAGQKNGDKLRRERLSPQKIAEGAFNSAGMSSLLPATADSVLQFTGNDPIFSYARTSGLGTGLLDWHSNPTTQAVGTALNAPSMLRNGVTQGEARQMLGLVPFQNALGIKNVLDALVQGLPEKTYRD